MKTSVGPPTIEREFDIALVEAEEKLKSLKVVRGRPVNLKGLRGWLLEQTVRSCIEDEMKRRGVSAQIREQVSIGGRASVDLVVGDAAIEIKSGGFFDDVGEKYRRYRLAVEARKLRYLYLTREETYAPYAKIARSVFGRNRAFFLDRRGDWRRFLNAVMLGCR